MGSIYPDGWMYVKYGSTNWCRRPDRDTTTPRHVPQHHAYNHQPTTTREMTISGPLPTVPDERTPSTSSDSGHAGNDTGDTGPATTTTSETATDNVGISVVVGVNGTGDRRLDALADAVAEFAGQTYATVHVVHAFTPTNFDTAIHRLNFDHESPPHPDTVAKRCAAVRNVTNRLHHPARNLGMNVEVHGRVTDDTGATIVDLADVVDADRVIVGGRRRTPAGKMLFGSTAQHVLLNADCPVTFVKYA